MKKLRRTLIIGAGEAGEMVAREMKIHPEYGYDPICFVDDDPQKLNKHIENIKVIAGTKDIDGVVKSEKIEQILIAIPSAYGYTIRDIIKRCEHAKIDFKIIPGIREIILGDVKMHQIKDIEAEDLLGRKTVELNIAEVGAYLEKKTILITGAGGSIGKEIVTQVSNVNPKKLVLFGKGENSIYEAQLNLQDTVNTKIVIGDIRDRNWVSQIFQEHEIDIVFHAAAHKHVVLIEGIPEEAFKNNVIGTKTVAEEAVRNKVEKFIMISTDKAVNPISVMGMTKRIAELVIQNLASKNTSTCLTTVRFGNVLGSRGSVIPLFRKQIINGGPVTVTHPEVTRYFMSISEACLLVIEAGNTAKGGETFILDMGNPIKIGTLARDLIILSGYEPDIDIEIAYIGLLPGEKISEELMTHNEEKKAIRQKYLWMVPHENTEYINLDKEIDIMTNLAFKGERSKLLMKLKQFSKQPK